jgi:tetratricopeptide (TPR) repeat protein
MPNRTPYRRSGSPRRAGSVAVALAACLGLACLTALGAGAAAAAGPAPTRAAAAPSAEPPVNRNDLQGWLAYQQASGAPSLPAVAHMFYRRGVETLRSGATEDGVRMLRGAIQLDPTFLAPHLALLSHYGLGEASQSLMELARLVELAKTHFPLQHWLVVSLVFGAGLAVFLATLVCALYVVWRRREVLRHGYVEFLGQFFPPRVAEGAAWALFALPFVAGFGLALPAAFTLAAMWSGLRRSERALTVVLVGVLVAIPLAFSGAGHMAMPDHPQRPPFYGTANLADEAFSEARLAELAQLSRRHPENPFLHYALAWMAYRGGRYEQAQAEFTAAGELWPGEPRIPNNLGNLAELAGHEDRAEALYRDASTLDPGWAMPHYNLGQLYTRQFRYAEASEELARATAYDFDLVRSLQAEAQSRPGDPLPAAWGWLGPQSFWDALVRQPRPDGPPPIPPGWSAWLELRGGPVVWLAVVLAALGAALGLLMRARLPVRQCSNCDAALCRRCAARRRDQVFCSACSAALHEASTPEFGRLLLARRRRQRLRRRSRWSLGLAVVLPGFGPLLTDRLLTAWLLLVLAVAGLLGALGVGGPFPYDSRIGPLAAPPPHAGALVLLGAVYCCSLLLYLALRGRAGLHEVHADPARKPASRLARAA